MSEEKTPGYLFVYGSLKSGYWNFDRCLADLAVSAKTVEYFGAKMFDLGPYPGLKMNCTGKVIGELVLVYDIEEALRRCDRLEGYNPERAEKDNYYNRREIEVDGVKAFTYEFTNADECLERGCPVIEEWHDEKVYHVKEDKEV